MRETLSTAEARRVTLAAQGLARAEQPASPGTRHLQSVMRRLGVVQIDSVNVFARAHHVPFFSRLGPYDPAALDRVLFGRRGPYVEYLAHEASLIPIADWGLWQFRMDAMRSSHGGEGSWFEKNAATVEWVRGELAIAGRRGFERRYALAADLADYYRLRDRPALQAAIDDLTDAGELIPVRVAGWERGDRPIPAWLHCEARVPRRTDGVALLSPFDPLVWFRERAERMFGFDYRIEIYTPAAKRRYGYYSLPVLVDDAIVARVDLKADRPAGVLRVQSAWWEPGCASTTTERIAAELRAAARWQGLDEVTVAGWGDAVDDLAGALGARRH